MPDTEGLNPQEQTGAEALTPLARLPDHKKLDAMLGVHMARAAKEYDDAMDGLRHTSDRANLQWRNIRDEMEKLKPQIDGFLGGKEPLTKPVAQACLRMMELERKLSAVVKARHISDVANYKDDDPKRPAIGREMGTPASEWRKGRSTVERWPKGVDGDKFLDGTGGGEPEEEKPAKPKGKPPVIDIDADLKNADWLRPNDPDNPKNRKAKAGGKRRGPG